MNTWIAQHFFNPAFVLPGAALALSPIIIHLLNRLRYRRVRFAAMEFLLQSEQRSRRRLRLEQLLLLLLRVLLVLGAVLLIGRLILDPAQMSLFRGAKAHHLVLLDDSGSMHDRWAETSAFDEALNVVRKLVAEGARRPDTQRFTLLTLSNPEQPLFTQRDVNGDFLNELDTKLENLACSHRALDLTGGLEVARKLLAQERATIRHLHVVSDFRNSDWVDQRAIAGVVKALDDSDVEVNLVRTVPESHQNLAVSRLAGDVHVAAAGVPLRFDVGVKNFGTTVARDVRVSVIANGRKLPLSVVFESIEPGDEVIQKSDLTFDTPGKHRVQVSLETDSLTADNNRFLAFDIVQANPVLIIDGDPAGREGSYVADALAADPSITGIAPLVEGVNFLRTQPLDRFHAIFMLNVAEIPADAIAPLKQHVASGGGLAWFVGEAVKPAFYNDKLFAGGNLGLFPVPLSMARREMPPNDATTPGPDLVFAVNPVFRIFEGQDNPFVRSVRVSSYLGVAKSWQDSEGNDLEWNPDDNVRKDGVSTIAWLRNKDLLAFEHRYGPAGGRVVTFLTTAGPDWNDWSRNPSFVVFQLELQKYIARGNRRLEKRTVGAPIELNLPAAEYLETVEITSPELAGGRVTRLNAAPRSDQRTGKDQDTANEQDAREDQNSANEKAGNDPGSDVELTAVFRETDLPGVYRVKLLDHDQVPVERWYSYNVPVDESNLQLATTADIRKSIGEDIRVQIQEAGNVSWIQGRDAGHEIRMFLLYALLAILVLEQLLSWKLSYHPKPAGAAA